MSNVDVLSNARSIPRHASLRASPLSSAEPQRCPPGGSWRDRIADSTRPDPRRHFRDRATDVTRAGTRRDPIGRREHRQDCGRCWLPAANGMTGDVRQPLRARLSLQLFDLAKPLKVGHGLGVRHETAHPPLFPACRPPLRGDEEKSGEWNAATRPHSGSLQLRVRGWKAESMTARHLLELTAVVECLCRPW
jgi:hypothetical protein